MLSDEDVAKQLQREEDIALFTKFSSETIVTLKARSCEELMKIGEELGYKRRKVDPDAEFLAKGLFNRIKERLRALKKECNGVSSTMLTPKQSAQEVSVKKKESTPIDFPGNGKKGFVPSVPVTAFLNPSMFSWTLAQLRDLPLEQLKAIGHDVGYNPKKQGLV